ncbi:MAG: MoxR family ATPase, partial [Pseudomonadota bacterium]|nr:MoxR family ATPase [Pseudomonadota bacterium]
MVVATQNPIESQGVYPLPEAQLDRFLFKLLAEYPSEEEEARIVSRFGTEQGPPRPEAFGIEPVTGRDALQQAIAAVKSVTLAPENIDYVVRLVRATRSHADLATGASPRAAVLLGNAARVRAALDGRDYVVPDDIKALATAVLRHRLILSAAAEIEGREVEGIVDDLIESTEAPR